MWVIVSHHRSLRNIPASIEASVGDSADAITLEKAGGVVVSDGPMLLVAAIGG